ncbi:transposase [Enterococcus sp. AZ109]|uniref:transposase n=1 Tax=Enterococcus sp. AZ109 TaxID=2774634 RepID=UPI003F26621C
MTIKGTNKPAVRMLVLIVGQKDLKKAHTILETHYSPVQYLCAGEGTARSELMDLLGLGVSGKAVFFCPILKDCVQELFEELNQKLCLHKPNRGCAFTFPITGASSYILKILNSEMEEELHQHIQQEEKRMIKDAKHSLIMVTVNQGFSEEVMEAANAAGSAGGTVLHARRLDSKETMKKWGISIQPEKEMIFLLVDQDKKRQIMRAIGEQCGLLSEAQGIVLSIPVEDVIGFDSALPK